MKPFRSATPGLLALTLACGGGDTVPPVFVDGRGVYAHQDSLLAYTLDDPPGVIVIDRHHGTVDTIGQSVLSSPVHVERLNEEWYVSDRPETGAEIVVLNRAGERQRTIDLADLSPTPHQFGVLPDGRVVVIGRAQRLLVRSSEGTEVFALADAGTRPSLLLGMLGGVLHAVPDQHITLYNGFGSIRWRVEWPWAETAYITDLSIDGAGRIHVLAGVTRQGQEFIAYSIVPQTGEVVRWSESSPLNTFSVSVFGQVEADSSYRWLR